MADLNKKTIEELTKLSRIGCSEEEQTAILGDLKKILAYVDQLREVDTSHVAPCNHVLAEIHNVMREDEVSSTIQRDAFLSNAPSQIGGMIRVPPVIKTN